VGNNPLLHQKRSKHYINKRIRGLATTGGRGIVCACGAVFVVVSVVLFVVPYSGMCGFVTFKGDIS